MNAIHLRVGFYITVRVYSSIAFTLVAIAGSVLFYTVWKWKSNKKNYSLAPLILIAEVVVISLGNQLPIS